MYIQVDEQHRILAARQEAGEGWLNCPDMVSDRVLSALGVPRYCYEEGRVQLRPQREVAWEEAALLRQEEALLGDLPAPLTDAERIAALEEELQAARILLGLEA